MKVQVSCEERTARIPLIYFSTNNIRYKQGDVETKDAITEVMGSYEGRDGYVMCVH